MTVVDLPKVRIFCERCNEELTPQPSGAIYEDSQGRTRCGPPERPDDMPHVLRAKVPEIKFGPRLAERFARNAPS